MQKKKESSKVVVELWAEQPPLAMEHMEQVAQISMAVSSVFQSLTLLSRTSIFPRKTRVPRSTVFHPSPWSMGDVPSLSQVLTLNVQWGLGIRKLEYKHPFRKGGVINTQQSGAWHWGIALYSIWPVFFKRNFFIYSIQLSFA